jgi:hypothetical protein
MESRDSPSSHQHHICTFFPSSTDISTANTTSFKYLGCYLDESNDRDMVLMTQESSVTVENCHHTCKDKAFTYFGLQAGDKCFCGNSYGKFGGRRDSECRIKCRGNNKQFCGGEMKNSVYFIKGSGESQLHALL